MENKPKLRPFKKFGPGYFIQEQMDERNWTQEDLSAVMGMTTKHINGVLQDKQPISLEIARILAEIFETSAEYWINLDTNYRLWINEGKSIKVLEAKIKGQIFARMPIRDMIQKGWLKATQTTKELEKQVLKFWDWKTLNFDKLDQTYLPYFTKKSEAFNQFNASYAITWYHKAHTEAAKFDVKEYDKKKLEKLYQTIHEYTTKENGLNEFIQELNKAGVIFFVLPHLQKTYLDGAAFLHHKNPVIVYTARYNRIDNFWFTMAHEIAHVLLHINHKTPFILDNLKEQEINSMENEANEMASKMLKQDDIIDFLTPYNSYLTTSKVEECAGIYNIHPSIVIGTLAHKEHISYSKQNRYKENALDLIKSKYKIGL
jgi:HTH-type transcriptional regulator/antitoxin HigA